MKRSILSLLISLLLVGVVYSAYTGTTAKDLSTTAPVNGAYPPSDVAASVLEPKKILKYMHSITSKTGAYTLLATDSVVNCTANSFSLTLPAVATVSSATFTKYYHIINSGTGTITLDGDGAETIDGATTLSVPTLSSVTVVGNGTAWFTVSEKANITPAGRALFDDYSATQQRRTLGLGSIATQNYSSVSIKGGTITGTSVLKYAVLRDVKAAGTAGGTATSGSWETRTLNEETYDTDSIVSLAANQFTLGAGVYIIEASAPATAVQRHQSRLANITDTTYIYGSSEGADDPVTTSRSFIKCILTLTGTKTFEIQHRVTITNADDGYGEEVNYASEEVYTVVSIWKIK